MSAVSQQDLQDHPGVRFPPPLVYAALFAIGWLLGRQWPLPITAGPSTLRVVAGVVGFGIWLALALSALARFRRARTSMIPNRAASALVIDGPYRFTRNPMYVSLLALYLGGALLLNTWWPVILAPALVFVIQRFVIAREERYLLRAFPGDYAAYSGQVRRWI